ANPANGLCRRRGAEGYFRSSDSALEEGSGQGNRRLRLANLDDRNESVDAYSLLCWIHRMLLLGWTSVSYPKLGKNEILFHNNCAQKFVEDTGRGRTLP